MSYDFNVIEGIHREEVKAEIIAFASSGKILNERPDDMSYDAYRTLLILQKRNIKLLKNGNLIFKTRGGSVTVKRKGK